MKTYRSLWALLALCLASISWAAPLKLNECDQLVKLIHDDKLPALQQAFAAHPREEVDAINQQCLLASAILLKKPKAITALLQWGVDPNQGIRVFEIFPKQKTPVMKDIDALLPPSGPESYSPLVLAIVQTNDVGVVDALLQGGAKVNGAADSNTSPLEAAMSTAHYSMVSHLLEAGASANPKDHVHITPLMELAHAPESTEPKQIDSLIEQLLAHGAQINWHARGGATALRFAVIAKNYAVAKALLEHGADPNDANDKGEKVLAWAKTHDQADMVQLLVQHGAIE